MDSCVLPLKKISWTVTSHHAIPSRGTARSVPGSLEVPPVPRRKEHLRDKMRWNMSGGCCTNWTMSQWTFDSRTNRSEQHLELFSSTPREYSMLSTDKSSAVVAVSLRESLTRSRTRLRRLQSDVNVSDGLAKFDHRAVTLIRHFLQRPVLKIVFDKCAFFWPR